MPYNPMAAPDREPLKFKNTVEGMVNRIISMQEAVNENVMQSLPDGEDPNAPYWDLRYKALDAVILPERTPSIVRSGSKLFTKEGKVQDNTQRPFQVAAAFAGLGINVFPGDPEGKFDAWCAGKGHEPIGPNPGYNPDTFIGNKFIVEKPAADRNNPKDPARFAAPLPTAVLGRDFLYKGDVREITPSSENSGGNVPPTAIAFTDVLSDEGARKQVLAAIDGKPVDSLDDALLSASIPHTLQINGESIMGAAVNGTLATALGEFVKVEDGKIVLS